MKKIFHLHDYIFILFFMATKRLSRIKKNHKLSFSVFKCLQSWNQLSNFGYWHLTFKMLNTVFIQFFSIEKVINSLNTNIGLNKFFQSMWKQSQTNSHHIENCHTYKDFLGCEVIFWIRKCISPKNISLS